MRIFVVTASVSKCQAGETIFVFSTRHFDLFQGFYLVLKHRIKRRNQSIKRVLKRLYPNTGLKYTVMIFSIGSVKEAKII